MNKRTISFKEVVEITDCPYCKAPKGEKCFSHWHRNTSAIKQSKPHLTRVKQALEGLKDE